MLGETAREIDYIIYNILCEDTKSAFDFLIKCLFLSQRLRHCLEIDGE